MAGYVVGNNGSMCPTVVHGRQAMVALLSRRIPNLKLQRVPLRLHRLRQKRRFIREQIVVLFGTSDGGLLVLAECVFDEA